MSDTSSKIDLFGGSNLARANYIRQIQRTVETYDIDLKVVLELVQNALDAATRNGTSRIWLDIDVPARRVTVRDQGPGFPPTPGLLFLGGTDKEDDTSQKGKIGVGLKAVIFSTKRFTIHSVGDFGVWDLTVEDADLSLAEAHLDSSKQLLCTQSLTERQPGEESGTTVTAEFRDLAIHEWLKSAVDAVFTVEELGSGDVEAANLLYEHGKPFPTKADAFLHLYFQTAPYTADVKAFLFGTTAKELSVYLKVGSADTEFTSYTQLQEVFKGTEYRADLACRYCDFEALLQDVPTSRVRFTKMMDPMPPGGDIARRLPDRVWILTLTTRDQFESLITSRTGAVAAGHENVLNKINGIYLFLADLPLLRGFIPGGAKRFISSNGIVTAHAFSTPRGARHELYVPRIHMIIDVDADLNYGKRHLTDRRLVHDLQQYFAEAYARTLFSATRVLSNDIRKPRDVLDRSYVGLEDLPLDIGIKKVPEVEQDVIAVFCALLGSKRLPEFSLYGISQIEQYDDRFYARRATQGADPPFTTDDHLHKLEFKYRASSLCIDFDEDVKDPREIALAIVWEDDIPVTGHGGWRMLDADISQAAKDGSAFPHVNHVLWDSTEGYEVQVLVLSEFVAALSAG